MKALRKKLICTGVVLAVCVSLTAPTLAKPGPAAGPGAGPTGGPGVGPAAGIGTGLATEPGAVADLAVDAGPGGAGLEGVGTPYLWPTAAGSQSAEELWAQFCQAEANKKLLELQEKALREQIRLLEHGGYSLYYGTDGTGYAQLMALKSQQYQIQLAKQQYELQKKQAEYQLKYLGEKPGKGELEYLLSTGAITPTGQSYQELQTQVVSLRWQEESLNTQMKALEYQYQLDQITDSQFVSQYAQLLQQKETVKLQREQADAEIKVRYGALGPGLGVGPGAGLLP